ncbi:hypothetical protein DXM29_20395 [Agrobacterium tumefaciens]|uniref:hypothetical protein n=1 Tax=Agrobacterium tumefaciens TaxID=358 RepID=UPI00122FCD32|nr:hypothetical protein DXM29_20395 [Agrobacterium tumefaciens]
MKKHIGNELKLMREGKKPLSMFYYMELTGDKDFVPLDDFKPYVEKGAIVMEEFVLLNPHDPQHSITYVLYALPKETWRIPALKTALMAQRDNFRRPDEGIDRIIGMLLGYPKKDIDNWIKKGSYPVDPNK